MFELAALERSFGFAVTRADKSGRDIGPNVTAELESGPLGGRRFEVDATIGP